jgi:hypothetical protein
MAVQHRKIVACFIAGMNEISNASKTTTTLAEVLQTYDFDHSAPPNGRIEGPVNANTFVHICENIIYNMARRNPFIGPNASMRTVILQHLRYFFVSGLAAAASGDIEMVHMAVLLLHASKVNSPVDSILRMMYLFLANASLKNGSSSLNINDHAVIDLRAWSCRIMSHDYVWHYWRFCLHNLLLF